MGESLLMKNQKELYIDFKRSKKIFSFYLKLTKDAFNKQTKKRLKILLFYLLLKMIIFY